VQGVQRVDEVAVRPRIELRLLQQAHRPSPGFLFRIDLPRGLDQTCS
jgi:hypothetical protein